MSRAVSWVKVLIEKVFDACDFNDTNEIFIEWMLGHLWRSGYEFGVDDERGDGLMEFKIRPRRVRGRFDVFEFVAEEGEFMVDAMYHIGAFVLIAVCNEEETECINVYWKDVKRMLSDELPIVEP